MSQRISQVTGHLTNSAGRGLLYNEVAIITWVVFPHLAPTSVLTMFQRCRTGQSWLLVRQWSPNVYLGHRSQRSDPLRQGRSQGRRLRVSILPCIPCGHNPYIQSSLDQAKANMVVDEIKKAGGDAIAVSGDVGADDFPEKVISATVNAYGKINHIVNNGEPA